MASFTALNGGSPHASDLVNGSAVAEIKVSGSGESPRTDAPAPASRHESTNSKTSRPTEDTVLATATAIDALKEREERERQMEKNRAGPTPTVERPTHPSSRYPDVDSSALKRKRSPSLDARQSVESSQREESEPKEGRQHSRPRSRDPSSFSPQKKHATYPESGHERRNGHELGVRKSLFGPPGSRDDWGPNYEQANSAIPNSAISEVDSMGDSLARAARRISHEEDRASPDDMDDSPMTPYPSGSYNADQQHRDGLVHSDPKKRKRNFSNRTKTGCLTCRKRKKKCDEAKPECSNCIRGGFVCAGYPPQRGTWPKPETKPATVQIESKDPTYIPPGAYGMPQSSGLPPISAPTIMPPQKREPLPSYRGQQLRIETPHQRLLSEDDRSPAAPLSLPNVVTPAPEAKLPAFHSSTVANLLPTPISARTPHEFLNSHAEYQTPKRVPPLHDLTRTDSDLQKPCQIPKINVTHDKTTHRPSSPPKPVATVQATAQLALSHTFAAPSRPKREKEEMMAGNPFNPYDKELVLERERCLTAVWRFNNSTNPTTGVSPTERSRLFKDVLQPIEPVQMTPNAVPPVPQIGYVGNGVVVEAPFHCDYGYNITIRDNVFIGRSSSISDSAPVVIGDNTYISPNVQIYTATLPTDPRRRNGALSQQTAQPVTIHDNVFIGANVTILPGVSIGAGSTIGAGSVVTRDIPAQSVAYGSPARPRRKIAYAT